MSDETTPVGRPSEDWDNPIVRIVRGARPPTSNLKLVVILTEGIRGHLNQSRGVALWLSRRTGADVLELDIPDLRGIRRRKARFAAEKLLEGNRRKARDWLAIAEGESVIRTLGYWLSERRIRAGDTSSLILISAGTMPSFYNIALGYIWRCTCVTIMTPSVIGTEPFDFAIVPEHDYPKEISNVLTTVGAPNLIVREELDSASRSMLNEFPPRHDRRWGVLIGGDDNNYRITQSWIQRHIGRILQEAERIGVDLYIATSRRTPREAENTVRRLAANTDTVRFLLMASEDPTNPVPAILGACDEVFVTDDSVNMVSETVTAGHRAVLLRADRVNALKSGAQRLTDMLVSAGILPHRLLWGPPRFDLTFDSFKRMGLLIEFRDWIRERIRGDSQSFAPPDELPGQDKESFNEARRAADWILENLGDVVRADEEE
ncbi:MAG: mitochondrial fission ELM1 family protein [Synergistaceae bacterium]|jgi:mitochondrial fission protein ELM1|nr:mitochondrial fission ELM1 family protein [Synergistaceae bacterium]